MKKLERLGETTTPDGTILALYRHDGAYLLRAGGVELMSTRRHHSEDRLAELACAPVRETPGARALIGGLGFGFTLRAALRCLAADAHVVVAEIAQGVIDWNRNPDYHLAGDALDDARVDLRHEDVATVLRRSANSFDAIMLDVDNGAAPLTTLGNAALYRDAGLRMAAAALRPGGSLAYWSATADTALERALRSIGLAVEVTAVRAHATTGRWHALYLARRRPA